MSGPAPKMKELGTHIHSLAFRTCNHLPHILLKIGKSSSGPDFQYSFNEKPTSGLVKVLAAPTVFMSNSYLGWDLELTLKAGIYAGAYWEYTISQSDATRYAKQFVNRLLEGTGETWYDDGGLSNAMKQSPEAQQLMKTISQDFRASMACNKGDFSKIKLDANKYHTPSFSFTTSPTLKVLVGGTQEMIVRLDYICFDLRNCRWNALISLEIRDDFGVTEEDITNASLSAKAGIGGLTDLWVLQHQRGKKPFTTVFKFSFFCYGKI
ncbi:MAG: hypothetical protein NTU44_07500 [Bacteroidetes bacterium]|nr:hypothetical protein [Bacteroidota bacterium]